MQLLDSKYSRCEMRIPLIYHLVELYLEVDTILLLHIDDEVDAGDEHEREEDAKDNVEVKVEDAGTAGREKE
jgi:hypothetical protein